MLDASKLISVTPFGNCILQKERLQNHNLLRCSHSLGTALNMPLMAPEAPENADHKTACHETACRCTESFIQECFDSMRTMRRYLQKNEPPDTDEAFVLIRPCGRAILDLLENLANWLLMQTDPTDKFILRRANDLIEMAQERVYMYPYKSVPACWPALFRAASLVKVTALALQDNWGNIAERDGVSNTTKKITPFSEDLIDKIVGTLDMSMITADPTPDKGERMRMKTCFDLLEKLNTALKDLESHGKLDKNSSYKKFPKSKAFIPPVTNPPKEKYFMTYPPESFQHHMLHPPDDTIGPEPLIITNAIESWPARSARPWSMPSYLLSKTIDGRRLVPIELGRSYVDSGWGQKLVTFKKFMDDYMMKDENERHGQIGYLAQCALFSQISGLKKDIEIPDYCYVETSEPHDSSPLAEEHRKMPILDKPILNAWFGPSGTISPLHVDPHHNILAQVVGSKYVRLYAPKYSHMLYPRGVNENGINMNNTSQIDLEIIEGWDCGADRQYQSRKMFPEFSKAPYFDCILDEGECLYIPVGWWHYVRSLSPSLSVNFWFNGDEATVPKADAESSDELTTSDMEVVDSGSSASPE
jgi:hypothetical protein